MALFKRRKKEEESSESQAEQSQVGKKQESKTSMKDLYKKDQEGKKEESKKEASGKKAATQSQKTQKKEKKQEITADKVGKRHGIAYRVLVKPIITEKSGDLGVYNKYVFEVARSANKIDVAKSIEEVYGVMPKKVNIIKRKGKRVRFGRLHGKRKDTKKAIVTLPQGKTINVYEGV